jgi:hypothetical protein
MERFIESQNQQPPPVVEGLCAPIGTFVIGSQLYVSDRCGALYVKDLSVGVVEEVVHLPYGGEIISREANGDLIIGTSSTVVYRVDLGTRQIVQVYENFRNPAGRPIQRSEQARPDFCGQPGKSSRRSGGVGALAPPQAAAPRCSTARPMGRRNNHTLLQHGQHYRLTLVSTRWRALKTCAEKGSNSDKPVTQRQHAPAKLAPVTPNPDHRKLHPVLSAALSSSPCCSLLSSARRPWRISHLPSAVNRRVKPLPSGLGSPCLGPPTPPP